MQVALIGGTMVDIDNISVIAAAKNPEHSVVHLREPRRGRITLPLAMAEVVEAVTEARLLAELRAG
jgi:hypothetical protein